MNVVILTPVRLFGDGLAACLNCRANVCVVAVVSDLASLCATLTGTQAQVALVDVTQGVDLFDVRGIAIQFPDLPIVAIGLSEQRQDVIACGRNGFTGYVSRDASIDALCKALSDTVAGRLTCPPEISCGLLRALFRKDSNTSDLNLELALTRRESEVLELLGRGLTNKEIGSELCLSVATVKHHVHHVLEKMGLRKRAQAMRRLQDAPWIAHKPSLALRKVP